MSTATTLDFTYRYPFPSHFANDNQGHRLALATCTGGDQHPHFFDGAPRDARQFGDLLLVLSEVVRTHFFQPRPPMLDPVVTSSEGMLRFEGFSGCCGVYARADLPAAAFDSEIQGRGTTNVDFNDPMRAALARIRRGDAVRLAVGRDEVLLERAGETAVEKKVKLPIRWLKGFSEVQAYQPNLELAFEVPAAAALRFVRGLPPSTASRRPIYALPSGRSLRTSPRARRGAVRFSGTHRVKVLQPLLLGAKALKVWHDESAGTSAWEVLFDEARFFLMLSPEVYRGFSGEGQVLSTLASEEWRDVLVQVRAHLHWQAEIDTATLAADLGVESHQVAAALAALGARGLAGYDVHTGAYFHRELPFDLDQVETLQPRLQGARQLLEKCAVELLEKRADGDCDLMVAGTDVRHYVRLRADGDGCTCPWFSRHRGERGPCKHVLAARLWFEQGEESE